MYVIVLSQKPIANGSPPPSEGAFLLKSSYASQKCLHEESGFLWIVDCDAETNSWTYGIATAAPTLSSAPTAIPTSMPTTWASFLSPNQESVWILNSTYTIEWMFGSGVFARYHKLWNQLC
jgi:hypothetical protein